MSAGPVANIRLGPGLNTGLESAREKAAAARREVKQLENDILRATTAGQQVTAAQAENLKNIKARSKQLNDIVKADIHRMREFRDDKFWDRTRGNALRGLARGDFVGVAESFMSSGLGQKVFRKLGLGSAADVLMRNLPQAFAARELIENLKQGAETKKATRESNIAIDEMYAKGRISKSAWEQLKGTGGLVRDYFSMFGFSSTTEKRQELLKQFEGLGDKALWPFRKQIVDDVQDSIRTKSYTKYVREHGGMALSNAERVNKIKEIGPAFKDLIETSKLELQREERQHLTPLTENEKTHLQNEIIEDYLKKFPALKELIDATELEAKELRNEDEIKRKAKGRIGKNTGLKEYEEEINKTVLQATWQEYRRGYTPFNRSE